MKQHVDDDAGLDFSPLRAAHLDAMRSMRTLRRAKQELNGDRRRAGRLVSALLGICAVLYVLMAGQNLRRAFSSAAVPSRPLSDAPKLEGRFDPGMPSTKHSPRMGMNRSPEFGKRPKG